MDNYLKTYKIKLKTLSPVFVGSGETIDKNEYIFDAYKKLVYIPNKLKIFQFFVKKGLIKDFENYILNDNRDFIYWLKDKRITENEYKNFCDYSLDSGDAVFDKKGKKSILSFMKDSYNLPYIPGSSLKGALRTAILAYELEKNKDKYTYASSKINSARIIGREPLKYEMKNLEKTAFFVPVGQKGETIDVFTGLKVSDSKVLSNDDLTLCQKNDRHIENFDNKLNILRECIKPETEIEFDLTIDTKLFPYKIEDIFTAINFFAKQYNANYRNAFMSTAIKANTIYLGGGAGYTSKTVSHQVFRGNSVYKIGKIFDATLSRTAQKEHKHFKDTQYGVSPHTLKTTIYRRKTYEFGACEITII